jgi:tetratricopeptide (TPR) repeat protein
VGENAVEANLILGGVAYAQGDLTKAQGHYEAALEKDPRNSSAYSDLGLTMARQGKATDAEACFVRAEQLDFENTVAPGLGRAYLKFAASDAAQRARAEFLAAANKRKNKAEQLEFAETAGADAKVAIDEAATMLTGNDNCLEENNPLNLLVRYFAGYALERQGDLKAAHEKYRSVIDNDHRYRMAIARLGVVLARFVEAEPQDARAEEFSKAADAHLTKAQLLNPKDSVLAYLLARFHSVRGTQVAKANRMFAIAAKLSAPDGDRDLPLWAAAGSAALDYRDEAMEVGRVKSAFNNVERNIRQMITRDNPSDLDRAVAENEVFQYCETCLTKIKENQSKRVVTYTFRTKPKSWSENKGSGMMVGSQKGSLQFRGRINYGGGDSDPLGKNSASYKDNDVKRDTFHAITVKGFIPNGTQVRLGMGIVKKRRSRQTGNAYSGVQIRRNEVTGNVEVRIDGARSVAVLKNTGRNLAWIELSKVPWKTGAFELAIEVVDRDKGTFRMLLKTGDGPGVNVIESEWGESAETTRLLTRGGGGGAFEFFIWVDGDDGTEYKGIRIDEVKLVKSVK